MSTSRCGPAEVLAADLDVASRQLELLSIVSLGADWFQNGRQGSPTRSLPNASLSLSEAADAAHVLTLARVDRLGCLGGGDELKGGYPEGPIEPLAEREIDSLAAGIVVPERAHEASGRATRAWSGGCRRWCASR